MSGQTVLPSIPTEQAMLPLRDVVVFPDMVVPLFVGRPKSIKALEHAMQGDRKVMLVAQRTAEKDEPEIGDMFSVGCLATILQMLKLGDGTVKVLVEGQQRAEILGIVDGPEHFVANVLPLAVERFNKDDQQEGSVEVEALRRAVISHFEQYVSMSRKVPDGILNSINSIDDAGRLADTIVAHISLKLEQKQEVLEMVKVLDRLQKLYDLLAHEVDILTVDKKIRGRVKRQMDKNQRDFYLNEQVKAIQKELGDGEDGADYDELEKKIKAAS